MLFVRTVLVQNRSVVLTRKHETLVLRRYSWVTHPNESLSKHERALCKDQTQSPTAQTHTAKEAVSCLRVCVCVCKTVSACVFTFVFACACARGGTSALPEGTQPRQVHYHARVAPYTVLRAGLDVCQVPNSAMPTWFWESTAPKPFQTCYLLKICAAVARLAGLSGSSRKAKSCAALVVDYHDMWCTCCSPYST